MKLKVKVLFITALLASVSFAIPSAGAVSNKGKYAVSSTSAAAPAPRVLLNRARPRTESARKTKRNLAGRKAGSCILSLAGITPQDRINLDRGATTIWHVLVDNNKWHTIRCLLGTDGHNVFAKEVVDAFIESFVDCVDSKRDRVNSETPLGMARRKGTVHLLKSCVPTNLSDDLRRLLPPELNTFRN